MSKNQINIDPLVQPSSSSSTSKAQLEMSHRDPSTSSSTKRTLNEMENCQVEKRLKEDESQVEIEEQSLIENLPPEMLIKILKYLDIKSLGVSRLMNRKWNGLAREIIKSRDDVEIVFNCDKAENGELTIGAKTPEATLETFMACFVVSKETPIFTRFRFNNFKPGVFDHVDWDKFISDFGKSVKCLKLIVVVNTILDNMNQVAEKLRKMLLDQLPNLQEFGLLFLHRGQRRFFREDRWNDLNNDVPPPPPEIRLFPQMESNEDTTEAVQLPHLKILYLDKTSFLNYTKITSDLLRVAVNLEKIAPFFESVRDGERTNKFQFLPTQGKFQCLEVEGQTEFCAPILEQLKETSKIPRAFKLITLKLHTHCLNNSNLFESSKDTLTEFTMRPIVSLNNLQFPKFIKLTKLCIYTNQYEKHRVFPLGLNLAEIFPVLSSLDLGLPWTTAFPNSNDLSPSFSSLETLEIVGERMTENSIVQISAMCPNLKRLKIGQILLRFRDVGIAIWTRMKYLQFLDIELCTNTPANSFPEIDSCITGFSKEDCIRLYGLIKDAKQGEKLGSQIKISQLELNAERKNPSILDLNALKKLKVRCGAYLFDCHPESGSQSVEKQTALTCVTEEFALKLMENLTYEIDEDNRILFSS